MGVFDSYRDTPNQIKFEGQEITINFDKTSPTTARISWTIPVGVKGCSQDINELAYCGMVVTIDETPTSPQKSPIDGNIYVADPTADKNLHAGDKIDTSLVIGAFYDDKTTTYFDITGLDPNKSYYVSGYAVDCEKRYHTQGVHSYSLPLKSNFGKDAICGLQTIELQNQSLSLSDSTNLLSGQIYTFDIVIDDPNKHNDVTGPNFEFGRLSPHIDLTKAKTISIDGFNAQTYQELLDSINLEFKRLSNPFEFSSPPNTNSFYLDITNNKLFIWDGFTHIEQNLIVENNDPTNINVGDYWVDDNNNLSQWDGITWNNVNYINFNKNPVTELLCGDYWFNNIDAFEWEGNTWCKKTLYNQSNNPSLPIDLPCGTYWYDTNDSILYQWDDINNLFNPTSAIYWNTDPNNLNNGTLWFDSLLNKLFQYDALTPKWDELTVTISNTEPTTPFPLQYWFNPDNDILNQRDNTNTSWVQQNVIIFDEDPTNRNSCDLWWDSVNDTLNIWDTVNNIWKLVNNFIKQDDDPSQPPILNIGDLWFNTTNNKLYKWDGSEFIEVQYINWPNEPNIPNVNDIWFNNSTNEWYKWDGVSFVLFDPINSTNDPTTLPSGSFWYNPTNNQLQQWNGVSFIVLSYSTSPLTPIDGTLWLDTNTNELKEWKKDSWILKDPIAIISFIEPNIFEIKSSSCGSSSNIFIDQKNDKLFSELASLLNTKIIYHLPQDGMDEIPDTPLYATEGIGTDGSPDERRELIDSIRGQLGYPIVEVELTKQQFDYCIDDAIEVLRQRTGVGYRRAFMFLDLVPGKQRYFLTNKKIGFNKIVRVSNVTRMSAAFLGNVYDNSAFGQQVIQNLYNMGTYDLISYHIVSDYIEQLEMLFATRIVFQFNEQTRALDILQKISRGERVLLDVSVERTEQDLISDRVLKKWVENWATAQAMILLSQIRGKYATLPGAGGGVSLNAADLYTQANEYLEKLLIEIDDFIVETPEEYGMETTLIIG